MKAILTLVFLLIVGGCIQLAFTCWSGTSEEVVNQPNAQERTHPGSGSSSKRTTAMQTQKAMSQRDTQEGIHPSCYTVPEFTTVMQTQEEMDETGFLLCSHNQKMNQVIMDTINAIPESDGDLEREEQLRLIAELTRQLRIAAMKIIDQQDEYLEVLRQLERTVARAPDELRQAAERFKAYAEEEKFEDLHDDYLVMASMMEALAKHYEKRHDQLTEEVSEQEFRETTEYLQRGVLMLERFELAISIATAAETVPEAAYYEAQLIEFIQRFDGFRSQLRRVNEMLQEPEPTIDGEMNANDTGENFAFNGFMRRHELAC